MAELVAKCSLKQPLQIHIRLDLGVARWSHDHDTTLIRIIFMAGPVGIHFYLRNQKTLPLLHCPFRHLKNNAQRVGKPFNFPIDCPSPYRLPLPGSRPLSGFPGNLQPALEVFPAKIPLDQPVRLLLKTYGDVLQTVMPGIRPDQKPPVRCHFRIVDGLPQKCRHVLLRMLFPFLNVHIDLITFLTRIRKDRRITVNSCPRYAFLLRPGIVKGLTSMSKAANSPFPVETAPSQYPEPSYESAAPLLPSQYDQSRPPPHPAAGEGWSWTDKLNPQTIPEKGNLPKRLARLIVRLPHTQQPEPRLRNVRVRYLRLPASGQTDSTKPLLYCCSLYQGAYQGQPRMTRLLIPLIKRKDNRLHLHLPGA
jgi:hypothetical protein